MRGRGFYPAADGLWKENGDRHPPSDFTTHPLIFLGQDFDKQTSKSAYLTHIANGYHEEWGSTWSNLSKLINDAQIPLSQCFFSNLFPGVRIDQTNTGPSTALDYPAFVQRCLLFLDDQIQILKPRALVIMGLLPFGLIIQHWLPNVAQSSYQDTKAIDQNRLAIFSVQRPYGAVKLVFIVHPAHGAPIASTLVAAVTKTFMVGMPKSRSCAIATPITT